MSKIYHVPSLNSKYYLRPLSVQTHIDQLYRVKETTLNVGIFIIYEFILTRPLVIAFLCCTSAEIKVSR